MEQRVVFMGTPPFAVASLAALVEAGVDVAAVVTAPDRPAGRGQQLRMSAVKEYALAHPILRDRILQPEKLKDPVFHARLDDAGASLYVVVAFRMLPEAVWKRPGLGRRDACRLMVPRPGRRAHQLGDHQRRAAHRGNHFFHPPGDRHR